MIVMSNDIFLKNSLLCCGVFLINLYSSKSLRYCELIRKSLLKRTFKRIFFYVKEKEL